MNFGLAGAKANEYYDGLMSYGDHMFVDEDVVSKHRVDSRVPTTGTLTQLMPDVVRKDFPDDTITVDPMKYDRYITDSTGLKLHHDARKRKRDLNREGMWMAQKAMEDPNPLPLFLPTTAMLDKIPHWTTDVSTLPPYRGRYRKTDRQYIPTSHWDMIYKNKLPNVSDYTIQRQALDTDRNLDLRMNDCSGTCR